MISYLRGKIICVGGSMKKSASVIIDVNGVGYQVTIPARHLGKYAQNSESEIFIHHHIWEGGEELYGFLKKSDADFFALLTEIPNIGPRTALNILHHADIEDIRSAVVHGNATVFSHTSGLGKKTAEKIILGLKDHLQSFVPAHPEDSKSAGAFEVTEALMSLGFTREQAQRAVSELPGQAKTTEEKMKEALKRLGRK